MKLFTNVLYLLLYSISFFCAAADSRKPFTDKEKDVITAVQNIVGGTLEMVKNKDDIQNKQFDNGLKDVAEGVLSLIIAAKNSRTIDDQSLGLVITPQLKEAIEHLVRAIKKQIEESTPSIAS